MQNVFKFLIVFTVIFFISIKAQNNANRFFYELSYKPNKDSADNKKVLMSLDICDNGKSTYRDYVIISQDSLAKAVKEKVIKSGQQIDQGKLFKMPTFTYKVVKNPSVDSNIEYTDRILQNNFFYEENVLLNWSIEKETKKIGEYNTQRAIANYGGRKWTAWFAKDIPINDGPYKFFGLPGLIVKIEDEGKNYSWLLIGNKKISNYNENTSVDTDGKKPIKVSKVKMTKMLEDYKNDPLGSVKNELTEEVLNRKMPNGTTVRENISLEENKLRKILNENNNPIELK
ncbi:GLPGLI family protein [Chryseobacterium bernardetii]|uniref:GLPGLI family protein n=1 Tax=Chryseobacterium bernardetii TaxID=1241978 RepID=UPI003AF6F5E6